MVQRRGGQHQGRSLIRRARKDPARFDAVYDAYALQLMRFIVRRVLDAELAFDLHSEVFAVAMEQRQSFRGTSAAEDSAWLYAIAKAQISGYWRRGGIERAAMARLGLARPDLDDTAIERIEELAEIDSIRPALLERLRELPDDQREALHLRFVDELSYQEIAGRLGISRDVVRARVSRGRRTLAQMLAADVAAAEGVP